MTERLALPGDRVGRLTAVPVRTDTGTGALTAPLLRRVALDMDGYQPASAARLSAVVMTLITTAVAARLRCVHDPHRHGRRRARRPGRVAARRVAGEHAADAHPRLHRAAPGRLRPGSRPRRGRGPRLGALAVSAVRGAGDDGGRMDQAPAPRTLPRGPGRPGPGQR